jgi:uncharacterized protein (DUF3820 family)
MFEKEDLLKLARMPMPFGKYSGRVLIDLPEEYLLWFAKKGFPEGEVGRLLEIALEIHVNGVTDILDPLRTEPRRI